jgi:hypothetical protein
MLQFDSPQKLAMDATFASSAEQPAHHQAAGGSAEQSELVGLAMPENLLSEQAEGTEEDWVRRVVKRTNAVKAIKRTETYARALLGCSHVPLSAHPEKDAFWRGAGVEMS